MSDTSNRSYTGDRGDENDYVDGDFVAVQLSREFHGGPGGVELVPRMWHIPVAESKGLHEERETHIDSCVGPPVTATSGIRGGWLSEARRILFEAMTGTYGEVA